MPLTERIEWVKSCNYKGFGWVPGAYYKVFWPQLNKWLMGEYIDGNRLGVTLYYNEDDTEVVHLYKDAWRICPSRCQRPPPPPTEAKAQNPIEP